MPSAFTFETRIRFIDTDASGRIHYTCMFRYFESAEIEFMRTLGISYGPSGIAFPRVHAECDYRLALVFDDPILIELYVTKLGRSSVRLDFRTLRDGELAAQGNVTIVCIHSATQRPTSLPVELRAKLEPFLHTLESAPGIQSGRTFT